MSAEETDCSHHRRAALAVVCVWACFLFRASFYCCILPLWEGYDEFAHFGYVQHLALEGRIPAGLRTPVSREIAESLLLVPLPWTLRDSAPASITHDGYWALSQPERQRRQSALLSLPDEWARTSSGSGPTIYEAQQPPLYFAVMAVPYRCSATASLPARVLLLRLSSVLLASLFIPAAWALARHVLGHDWPAVAAVATIALIPGLLLDITHVGNDSLALALFSILTWRVVRTAGHGPKASDAAVTGLVLGLGLLTKAYFLTAVPVVILGLWLSALRKGRRNGEFLRSLLAATGTAAAVAGWWVALTWIRTGSLSGLMQDVALRDVPLGRLLARAGEVDWLRAADSTFFSYVWFGNWSFLQLRSWMYHGFRYLAWLSLIGLAFGGLRRLLSSSRQSALPPGTGLLLLFLGFFVLGLGYHVLITFVANASSSSAGWYLYCLVVAEALLVTIGLAALLPQRMRFAVLPAGAVLAGLLDLYGTHFLLVPYYTGVIAHNANGALATLHVSQLWETGFSELVRRLAVNKPPVISPGVLTMLWCLYIMATLCLVGLSFSWARRRDERASPER